MTYFETPTDKAAAMRGMTTDAYVAMLDATIDSVFEEIPGAEDNRFVSESDVLNPDEPLVWGYGWDHRVLIPGCDE